MSTTPRRNAGTARAMAPARTASAHTAAARTAAALAASALLLVAGCAKHGGEAASELPAVSVTTEKAATLRETAFVEAVGTLKAGREATIAGKVMGTVTEIRQAGDVVHEGDILVVVDSRDVAGQVAQAEGALAQAKAAAVLAETNFHRFEQLHERSAASTLELDQARYQFDSASGAVKQAEGAVAAARSVQTYARIPAPFSGRVVDRMCEPGDLASPGRPLLKIEDTKHVRLIASLEASRAGAAVVGKTVEVRVPELGDARFAGTIREVTPGADAATRSVLVKIDLAEDATLRSGLFGRALLASGERDVLRVPASAVVRRGSFASVFVDVDGRAALRMVTLADDGADRPEVLSGLSAGDVVVVNPPATLEIGTRLEARS
ncbi:MAG: efflux RND transporter periplasmic adaptor subunit [bacterium]